MSNDENREKNEEKAAVPVQPRCRQDLCAKLFAGSG